MNVPIYYVVYNDCNFGDSVTPWFWGPFVNARFGINLPTIGVPYGGIWPPYRAGGSFHTGGCNALMGDGSTQWIGENIDQNLLVAMSTIGQSDITTNR
jgi:prepilin-type processing-associated H-X9-DG protein